MPNPAALMGLVTMFPRSTSLGGPRAGGLAALALALLLALGAEPGLAAPAAAEGPTLNQSPAHGGFEQGLLFRVDPPGDAEPSWLFGTIHSHDPRVLDLPAEVEDALADARGLAIEVVPDDEAMRAAQARMLFGDSDSLRGLLPPDLYRETVAALAQRGLPEAAAGRFKPWAVVMLLSMPPGASSEILDLQLQQRARAAGKPVVGLESVTEQLAVFEDFSAADQVALLEDALAGRDALPETFERLTRAYLARDLAGLLSLEQEQLVAGDPALAARFRRALVDERNLRIARRLAPLLQEGGHFVAVGALHLPGDGGLLDRLREAGYKVQCVY